MTEIPKSLSAAQCCALSHLHSKGGWASLLELGRRDTAFFDAASRLLAVMTARLDDQLSSHETTMQGVLLQYEAAKAGHEA